MKHISLNGHQSIISDCLVTIVREEGVLGLYKGVVPALLLTSHGAIQVCRHELIYSKDNCTQFKTYDLFIDKNSLYHSQFASYEWLKSQSKDLRSTGGDQVIITLFKRLISRLGFRWINLILKKLE